MKRLFIDTNVVLDLILQREPHYKSSAQLFELAHKKEVTLVVSSLSIVNAHYVLKKFAKENTVRAALLSLSTACKIAPIDHSTINQALGSALKDFEDGVQYACALEEKCEAIITGDKKDFQAAKLPTFSAQQFIGSYLARR